MPDSPKKWMEIAAQVQADVIAKDASEPGAPISDHDFKRATLHTRHDMVIVTTLLAFVNQQNDSIDRKLSSLIRLSGLP